MSRFDTLKNRFDQFNIAEKIIVLNVVFFVIPFFIRTLFYLFNIPANSFFSFFELSPHISTFITQPWTLITYGFLHGSIGHILWNMLLLYYSSQFFLNLFSSSRFINVYFLGILTGGVLFLVSYFLFPVFKGQYPPLVGSSAGVMAILIFSCTYMPYQEVRILFFNLKLMYLGIGLVVLDILQIPTSNAGGHIAHLGGAFLGYIFASQLQKGTDIGVRFERLWRWLIKFVQPTSKLKTVHRRKRSPKTAKFDDQQKIDAILDKISASGYDSLTAKEKEFLFKSGKK